MKVQAQDPKADTAYQIAWCDYSDYSVGPVFAEREDAENFAVHYNRDRPTAAMRDRLDEIEASEPERLHTADGGFITAAQAMPREFWLPTCAEDPDAARVEEIPFYRPGAWLPDVDGVAEVLPPRALPA